MEHGERESGGADRDRTGDPLLAKQALSQLSYSPSLSSPARRRDDETAGDPARTWMTRKSAISWWVWMDLNHRPHAYQACALTN